jgi:PPOX class probable F420-dependent enzyme
MLNIDTNTEFGARVERRLAEDTIIWLTTVRPNGTPEPSPVWFLWDGETALIYSRPNMQKLRNIAANPNVALSFNTTSDGGDVIVFSGTAVIDERAPSADQLPAYVAKYAEAIKDINMTPEYFAKGYSVAVRVTPTKVRGH